MYNMKTQLPLSPLEITRRGLGAHKNLKNRRDTSASGTGHFMYNININNNINNTSPVIWVTGRISPCSTREPT